MNKAQISEQFEVDNENDSPNISVSDAASLPGLMDEAALQQFSDLVARQLHLMGEDPERDGLQKTPMRVAKAFEFLTRGYWQCPKKVLNDALFDVQSDEMVIVKDIDFYSLCEHHLLPFFGRCHIAYIPTSKVVRLSKLPRMVEVFARRLQVQERMTTDIAKIIDELIKPRGVAVVIEAQHLCMAMRGVEKQSSYALTSSMLGAFRDDARTRAEFLDLIKHHRRDG
jgi:GTP cyclohydrolase I